jgi:general secretion pathway protein G
VIGKAKNAKREMMNDESKRQPKVIRSSLVVHRSSFGFTLLELIIVISIIVILALIVLPRYQTSVLHAKEATLKNDLVELRKMIDQYAADKGQLPASLDDLVSAGYIQEIPIDPMTGQKDWNVEMGEDPNLKSDKQGIRNVHSSSTETSSEGTPYSEW